MCILFTLCSIELQITNLQSFHIIRGTPGDIDDNHMLKATEETKNSIILPTRYSDRYVLEYDKREYSLMYTLSLVKKYAKGKELEDRDFSSGKRDKKLSYITDSLLDSDVVPF